MITHFGLLEADFAREYRIDLADALVDPWAMSWRRFRQLLHGLSPDSWWSHLARKAAKTPAGIEAGMSHLRAMAEPAAS